MLKYEEWYSIVENTLNCLFAENGADREMDFDVEDEFRKAYDAYLNTYDKDNNVFVYDKCFIPLW